MTIRTLLAAWVWVAATLFTPFAVAEQEATPAQESITTESFNDSGEAVRLETRRNTGGGIPAVTMQVNPDGSEDYSVTLQILALMTALGFFARGRHFNDVVYADRGGHVHSASSDGATTNTVQPSDHRYFSVFDLIYYVAGDRPNEHRGGSALYQ